MIRDRSRQTAVGISRHQSASLCCRLITVGCRLRDVHNKTSQAKINCCRQTLSCSAVWQTPRWAELWKYHIPTCFCMLNQRFDVSCHCPLRKGSSDTCLYCSRCSSVGGCSREASHPMGQPVQPSAWGHHDGIRHPVYDVSRSRHGGAQGLPALPTLHPSPVGRPGHPERLRPPQRVPAGKCLSPGCYPAFTLWAHCIASNLMYVW